MVPAGLARSVRVLRVPDSSLGRDAALAHTGSNRRTGCRFTARGLTTQTLIQHDEYLPSGEPWQDETDSKYELARRFSFTGKELDIHTGLYDYGARSYDARMGVWLSPDPILGRYMGGEVNAGVYSVRNLQTYTYSWGNPINIKDPNGREIMLVGPQAGKMLQLLSELSGLPLVSDKYGTVRIAAGPPEANRAAGARLVSKLIESSELVTLEGTTGTGNHDTSSTMPASVEDAVDGTPTGAVVKVDTREDVKTRLLVRGAKGTELEKADREIVLGHELAHADTLTSGTLQNGTIPRSFVDEKGQARSERVKHDEVRAMHIENQIRSERGLKEREAYQHREAK